MMQNPKLLRQQILNVPAEKVWEGLALAVITAVGGALRFANLEALGYVNHYYSAAMVSMLKSWYNFFYLAAEPGGAVSVDKPPLGLWIQAVFAGAFGINSLGLLLPNILAGVLSIGVLYYLVRRSFGPMAGLAAAAALAVTPVMIATDRNNTSDSLLILSLLLAAWAFLKALETGQMRFLLLGMVLGGLAFNIKMLAAFLPLPAFYGVYFLGSPEHWWRKAGKLLLGSIVLMAVSLSWVTVVDLTPAGQRPYIGSSGDNTELSLITGYNGLNRLYGLFGGPGGGANRGGPGFAQNNGGGFSRNSGNLGPGGLNLPAIQAGNSGTAGGMIVMGQTGPFRLLIPPLSKNVSWLLPFGLAGVLLLLFRGRWRWPLDKEHLALVLWGGWLLTGWVFFSIAGFFHEYYLSLLGPPLAALVGLGAGQLWDLRKNHARSAFILLLLAVLGTLAFQVLTVYPYLRSTIWLQIALLLVLAGAVIWGVARQRVWLRRLGYVGLVGAVLIAPGTWSVLTNQYPSLNQSLPSVYSGQSGPAVDLRGLEVDQALLDYVTPRTQGVDYLMAVPSAMQGSDYVIATGRPVLYLGGFMGIDRVLNAEQLSQWVMEGKLRFIYWDARRSGSDAANWVLSNCSLVPGFETSSSNSGAPRGTSRTGVVTNQGGGFGNLQLSLYDCGKE
jgi:4-amino-4-deoxy-L-arabinose transferase-like glycosyltransferase